MIPYLKLPVVLDGATGTALQKRGMPAGVCTEQWVLEHPQVLQQVQRSYVQAGSQVIYAPTFGANRIKLGQHHIEDQTAQYNKRLFDIAREAAGDQALVAADIAPTGLFIKPFGDTDFETLVEVYTEQAKALAEAGADLFVVETTMTMAEARAAVLAIRSVSEKPIFVSFTCDETGRCLSGTDMAAALVTMQRMGVTAFGLNCSTGPDEMLRQLQRIAPYADVHLIAKPNAGLPQVEDGHTVYHCPAEEFASFVPALAEAGVRIFGGCCGTDETHIAAICAAVDAIDFAALEEPQRAEGAFCATERNLIALTEDAEMSEIFECDEDLEDELMDAEEQIVRVSVETEEDAAVFGECAYAAANSAMYIVSQNRQAFEQALRVYQGVALCAADAFDAEFLQKMQDKYGVIAV